LAFPGSVFSDADRALAGELFALSTPLKDLATLWDLTEVRLRALDQDWAQLRTCSPSLSAKDHMRSLLFKLEEDHAALLAFIGVTSSRPGFSCFGMFAVPFF
jgi:hypothetical protein